MTEFTVIGAGMAGLLASSMLRKSCVRLLEKQDAIPNNHSAVLRFRSSVVGDALNIPFKRVTTIKAIQCWQNPVADAIAYSIKTNGTGRLRSIISASGSVSERFIAPQDLISRMAEIVADRTFFNFDINEAPSLLQDPCDRVISTVPMPMLMKALNYSHDIEFNSVPGININVTVPELEAYASLYVPDPGIEFNRISITGDQLTIEMAYPDGAEHQEVSLELFNSEPVVLHDVISHALELVGAEGSCYEHVTVSPQRYAKILPIDEKERKKFIMWASETYGVYSLGRFATWRPGLLLDDVVQDVRVIQRIAEHGNYDHRKGGTSS